MNSNYVPVIDTKVYETTWEDEAANGTIVTAANAAITALAGSDNYICLAASIDQYETRNNVYLRATLYFGDTDVNPEIQPPISEIDILCNKTKAAVSSDYVAWLAAKAFTAPEGVKNTQTISTSYRGHDRYATLVNITANVGAGFESVVSKTADFTLSANDDYVVVNPAATTTATLPDASAVLGKSFTFMTQDVDQIINLSPSATDAINDNTVAADVNIGLGAEGAEDNREWKLTAIGANLWNLAPMAEDAPRENVSTITNVTTDITIGMEYILADSSGGAAAPALPAANAALVGKSWVINTVDVTNAINLTPNAAPGTDTINGVNAAFNIGGGTQDGLAYRQWRVTCTAVGAFEIAPFAVIAARSNITTVSAGDTHAITTVDDVILASSNGSNTALNLPAADAGLVGWSFIIDTVAIAGNELLLNPNGTEDINGAGAGVALNLGGGGAAPAPIAAAAAGNRYTVLCTGVGTWRVQFSAIAV